MLSMQTYFTLIFSGSATLQSGYHSLHSSVKETDSNQSLNWVYSPNYLLFLTMPNCLPSSCGEPDPWPFPVTSTPSTCMGSWLSGLFHPQGLPVWLQAHVRLKSSQSRMFLSFLDKLCCCLDPPSAPNARTPHSLGGQNLVSAPALQGNKQPLQTSVTLLNYINPSQSLLHSTTLLGSISHS